MCKCLHRAYRDILSYWYAIRNLRNEYLDRQAKELKCDAYEGAIGLYDRVWLRNKNQMKIGKGSYIDSGADIWIHDHLGEEQKWNQTKYDGELIIGSSVFINKKVNIDCYSKIVIGDDCLFASNVYITDMNHGMDINGIKYVKQQMLPKPISIEKGVWIGERVCILAGSIIGEKSIIGTGAVVTGVIPPYSIAVGVLARVIKTWNFKENNWECVKDRI